MVARIGGVPARHQPGPLAVGDLACGHLRELGAALVLGLDAQVLGEAQDEAEAAGAGAGGPGPVGPLEAAGQAEALGDVWVGGEAAGLPAGLGHGLGQRLQLVIHL